MMITVNERAMRGYMLSLVGLLGLLVWATYAYTGEQPRRACTEHDLNMDIMMLGEPSTCTLDEVTLQKHLKHGN